MIKSFKSEILENFYEKGEDIKIQGIDNGRLQICLFALDSAEKINDLNIPSFNLKKCGNSDYYSITLSQNKKLKFKLLPKEK